MCFLWHLHQPFYKDLVSGAYKLPWARLHALKDYHGMVKILGEFPRIQQTFNLAPSLLMQIEEYASGRASDRFLQLALKPAEQLTSEEKDFILKYFFQANEERLIDRYPRYAELLAVLRQTENIPELARGAFDPQMVRDLQILSQLAWFDEEYLAKDPEVRALKEKGRSYSLADQALLGRKQAEILGSIVAAYRDFAERGQIELSTSAFYHPILPLLCDSNIAGEAHPYMALPTQFAYPGDAEEQLARAKRYFAARFGTAPLGTWPPEGAISDEALRIAASLGFRWTASDDGVLEKSCAGRAVNAHKPYFWRRGESSIHVVFRDRRLSDLIGSVYAQMDANDAADHFMRELHANCEASLQAGEDALVPIILDGENPWESYFENGRPFLRALYARISADAGVAALTMSEGISGMKAEPLAHVHPGSWIDANFDIWVGATEDNRAWEQLLGARRKYENLLLQQGGGNVSEADRSLAWEELLIAEGSDWFWWYGPEHASANRSEFDQLFRNHLANVYRLLGEPIPPDLTVPILEPQAPLHTAPSGLIQPTIDGMVSSRGEWRNAGRCRADSYRAGALHCQRPPIQELHYGSDGQNIYLRVGLLDQLLRAPDLRVFLLFVNGAGERFEVSLMRGQESTLDIESRLPEGSVSAALIDICEVRVAMAALHVKPGSPLFLKVSVTQDGLPVGALPVHGELELKPIAMAAYTY